ncbi:MAG: tetratricopeptide repeat protein [Pirellulales bacterium]|nr:tetratricopeptide repeat protein [Pirellulales bacterium]
MRAATFALVLTTAPFVVLFTWGGPTRAQDSPPATATQPAAKPTTIDPFQTQQQAIDNLQRGQRRAESNAFEAQRRAASNMSASQTQAIGQLQRGERSAELDASEPIPMPQYGVRSTGGQPRRAQKPPSRGSLPQPNLDRFNPALTAQDYLGGAGAFSYMGPRYPTFAGGGQNWMPIPPTSIGFVPDGMGGVTPAFGGMMMQNGMIQQGVGFVPDGLGGLQVAPYIIPPVTPGPIGPNGMPMSNYPFSNLPGGPAMLAPPPTVANNGVIPPDPYTEQAALQETGLLPSVDKPQALDQPENNAELTRAIRAFRDRRYREALRQLDTAAAQAPLDGSIELLRAQTLFAQGEFDESAAALDRALSTLPSAKWGSVLADGSSYYFDEELYSRQLDTLTGWVGKNPKDPSGHYLLAYHLGYQGRAAEAVRELQAAMSLGRRDPQTIGLYTLFDQEAKRQEAEAAAAKAAEQPDATKEKEPMRMQSGHQEF